MLLNQLHKALKDKNIKFLLIDCFDVLIHRSVDPNYVQKIWAKLMIRELGLTITIDALYSIRQSSAERLSKVTEKQSEKTAYSNLKEDVYNRLLDSDITTLKSKEHFVRLFEAADLKAESSIQYLNQGTVDALKYFKSNGGHIYLVSNFYGSKNLIRQLLEHHELLPLFDDIFTTTDYQSIISELSINTTETMVASCAKETNREKTLINGLHTFSVSAKKHRPKNVRTKQNSLNEAINTTYKAANKTSAIPYTEYIVFYHIFIERLYTISKQKGIKDLFFLAREGQFLKKLFDSYQEFSAIDSDSKINTHYLKISRHASLQINLKAIELEEFSYLKNRFSSMTLNDFLQTFNYPENLKNTIALELKADADMPITNFIDSALFDKLKKNQSFIDYYNTHRKSNSKAFKLYIESFNCDIESNGITLVDIGWGGKMQEAIYKFFENKVPVTAYYLGLSKIYNIRPDTQRFGLNFSILPFKSYNDYILLANKQLYEQFSAANHGSTLGYNISVDTYTIEHHNTEEKWLYDNFINQHQDEMFNLHKTLLKTLEPLCYNNDFMQDIISKLALKIGLFQNTKKLKFLGTLADGFYQNIGNNSVGISYEIPKIKQPIRTAIKFLITPENYFRYLVKIKPTLYKKNKFLAFFVPSALIYFYFRLNKYLRFSLLKK